MVWHERRRKMDVMPSFRGMRAGKPQAVRLQPCEAGHYQKRGITREMLNSAFRAERAIKPFVISRNNWLFCSSKSGAEASAGIYSIVTTARANGLDNERYIEGLLTEMPNAGELTDEVVDGFLPWSGKVPQECKLKPEVWEKAREMRDEPIVAVDPAAFEDEDEYGPTEDEVLSLEMPPERAQD